MHSSPSTAAAEDLERRLDRTRLPRHIAIIMDGSGRWARRRLRPRVAGHVAGVQAVRTTVETCARLHIPALTLYSFSAENWKRPAAEVAFLMKLLRRYLRLEAPALARQNIRLEAMGRTGELPDEVQRDLIAARAHTAHCTGMVLTLALNYSARAELADACQGLMATHVAGEPVTEEELAGHLYTAGLPEVDLLIRTSGEMRVSNFLLWQIAYAEIWVTRVLWPDFGPQELLEALADFQRRERRFGGLGRDVGSAAGGAAAGAGAAIESAAAAGGEAQR